MNNFIKLRKSFYERDNVVEIARDLLGKYLFTHFNGELTGGKIVETEAYNGLNDRACHAYKKRTPRTEVMYGEGGRAYVYLCYGIHHLFNIVTNKKGFADAVLIRGIQPVKGIDVMKERCHRPEAQLTNGPGKLSQALSIVSDYSGTPLDNDWLYVVDDLSEESPKIEIDVRIGVDYAGEDAQLPWRFFIPDNPWVSKQKKAPIYLDQGSDIHKPV